MHQQHPPGGPLPPAYGPENPLSTGPFPPSAQVLGPPPSDDGWGKVGVLMVLMALVFAGGVAYFIATSSKAEAGIASGEESAESEEGAGAAAAAEAGDTEAGAGAEEDGAEEIADKKGAEDVVAASAVDSKEAGASDTESAGETDGTAPEDLAPEESGSEEELLRENGEVDRPTGLVSMSIESEPAGAQVIRKRDGVRLGLTPYRYDVEAATGKVTFILKLEGYRSKSINIPTDRDSVRQVMLFPGKGGEPIPEPDPAAEKIAKDTSNTKVAAATKTPKESEPVAPEEPAVKSAPKTARVKKKTRPKKNRPKKSRPKKTRPRKSAGTVDYTADPIPLD